MNTKRYVVCIDDRGCPASLEVRKLHALMRDDRAGTSGQVRVIDESGEDYLHPADRFVEVELSADVATATAEAA